MSLGFIIGGCGCGKTVECVKRITALEQAGENSIFIVPQQFTLETERLLLENSREKAIMRARVLSFRRLAYVLMGASDMHKPALSALGKAFVIRKTVYDKKDELQYFSKVIDKQGFLDSLINLITEFYQYGISPEMLWDAYEKIDKEDGLSLKLKDLYLIYSAYREYVGKRYVAPEETLDILARDAADSDIIKNAHIFIDGIDYFIPQEYNVIRSLMRRAKSVTVSLCGNFGVSRPKNYSMYDPYYEAKRTANRLCDMAEECGCAIEKPVYLNKCRRHEGKADMQHLFAEYFKNKYAQYKEVPKHLHITRAANINTELDGVCREISRLVREKNYRYDSIAVIIDKSYEQPLKNRFNAYGIPVFIDSRKPLTQHPLTELITDVLDILGGGIKNKTMLKYAKNMFSPVEDEDVCYLENYILKHGINNKAWFRKTWNIGFSDTESEGYLQINGTKNALMESLEGIRGAVEPNKEYDVKYFTEKIYEFLFSIGADEKVIRLAEEAKEENDLNAFRQHSGIWDELLNVFETMAEIIDTKTDAAGFAAVLRSGLEMCGISIIPPTQDNIIIGDTDRSRLPEIKAMFILGANEGVIPPFAEDIGLFGDSERTMLTENFFEMSADNIHKINMTDLNIYSLMLKPTDGLYISCTAFNTAGKRTARSPVISKLLKLFPKLAEEEKGGFEEMPPSPEPAFEEMLKGIAQAKKNGNISDAVYESYYWFRENEAYRQRLDMLKRVANDELAELGNTMLTLSEACVKKLYGNVVEGSVSRLENYARCPFAYFLKYGLHIRERDVYEFDALHLGNLFHSVLEDFSEGLKKENKDWRGLDESEITQRVSACVEGIVPKAFNEIIAEDPHFKYTMKRVKNVMSHSIKALCTHVRAGRFAPREFEVGFGINKALPPIVFDLGKEKRMILSGKIDRVDLLESSGGTYVKIIDYKSSSHDFSKEELYYGLQLQLILYMDSYIRTKRAAEGKNLLPGGVFYFRVSDPLAEKNRGDENIEQLILEQYEMNGLILNDDAVLDAIGERTAQTARSKEKIETVGSYVKADADGFAKLCADAEEISRVLGKEMLAGNISMTPSKCGGKTGCDHCELGSICRFEVRENAAYRTETVDIGDKDE